jgi:hypothetical protein
LHGLRCGARLVRVVREVKEPEGLCASSRVGL